MTQTLTTALAAVVIGVVSVTVYLLPTFVAWARHVPHLGSVTAVNVLLGWTLAGWTVALAMALRSTHSTAPVVQIVQSPPPPWPSPPTFPPPAQPAPLPRPPDQAPPLRIAPGPDQPPETGPAQDERR